MRAVTLIQALLGLSILAAMPVVGRGVAPIVLAVQVVGGLGVLAAALASIRTTRGREVDL